MIVNDLPAINLLLFALVFPVCLVIAYFLFRAGDKAFLSILIISLFFSTSIPIGPVRNFRLFDAVMLLIAIRAVVQILITRKVIHFKIYSFLPLLLLFAFANVISLVYSKERMLTLTGVIQSIEFVLLYIVLVNMLGQNLKLLYWGVKFFMICLFVELGYAVFVMFQIYLNTGAFFRAEGTLEQFLGLYLSLGTLVCLGWYFYQRLQSRWIPVLAMGMLFVGVFLTTSRGFLISTLVAILGAGYMKYRRAVVFLGLAMALVLTVIYLVPIRLIEQFAGLFESFAASRITSLIFLLRGETIAYGNWTATMRFNLSYEAYLMFLDHPLTGVGAKNYFLYIMDYATPFVLEWAWSLENVLGPHNQYFSTLAEMGIFGIAALLGLFLKSLWRSISMVKMAKSASSKAFSIALVAIAWFFIVQGFAGEFMFGILGALFVIFLAYNSVVDASIKMKDEFWADEGLVRS